MVKVTTTQVWVSISLIAIFGVGGSAMIFFSMPDSGNMVNDTKPTIVKEMPKIVESAPVVESAKAIGSVEIIREYPQTSVKELDDNFNVKTTIVKFTIPLNNTLPWGTIQGIVENPAPGHPVIIQFFKSLDETPVHVAQVDVSKNNLFEYKIRLLTIDDGKTTHIYQGDYFIQVTKVVMKQ